MELIDLTKDFLTVVNTQYYNSGSMNGCNGTVVSQGTGRLHHRPGVLSAAEAARRPGRPGLPGDDTGRRQRVRRPERRQRRRQLPDQAAAVRQLRAGDGVPESARGDGLVDQLGRQQWLRFRQHGEAQPDRRRDSHAGGEPVTVYTNGGSVSHQGRNWMAKWWTQGEEPGTTGPDGVWADKGAC